MPAVLSRPAYTLREVARFLAIHVDTLRGWVRDGTVPTMKLGGRHYVAKAWLEALRDGTLPPAQPKEAATTADPRNANESEDVGE